MWFNLIHVLSMVVTLVLIMFYGRHYGLSKLKSFISGVVTIVFFYFFMLVLAWAESGFKEFGSQNLVRVFAFAPFIFYLESKLLKIDFRDFCDMNAVWPMLFHGLTHYACIIAGCCYGFRYIEGTKMYALAHFLTGTDMLPNQAFEATAAVIISIVMYIISRKHNYHMGGRLFSIMLIIFGVNRFGWEFLRNNKKLIVFGKMANSVNGVIGISSLAFYCLAMIVVGIAFLFVFNHMDKKQASIEKKDDEDLTESDKQPVE